MIGDIIAILLVLAAAVYAARWMWRSMRGDAGCGSSCGGCASSGDQRETSRQVKVIPLVTVNVMHPEGVNPAEAGIQDRIPAHSSGFRPAPK
ncbi:MAG: FeoB-associated Cys-rich membrane protein [Phycisphaerae bacterium]|nr:FeoB-associated Cys-rich membrane protein [Phycisphaerae bacterium]